MVSNEIQNAHFMLYRTRHLDIPALQSQSLLQGSNLVTFVSVADHHPFTLRMVMTYLQYRDDSNRIHIKQKVTDQLHS